MTNSSMSIELNNPKWLDLFPKNLPGKASSKKSCAQCSDLTWKFDKQLQGYVPCSCLKRKAARLLKEKIKYTNQPVRIGSAHFGQDLTNRQVEKLKNNIFQNCFLIENKRFAARDTATAIVRSGILAGRMGAVFPFALLCDEWRRDVVFQLESSPSKEFNHSKSFLMCTGLGTRGIYERKLVDMVGQEKTLLTLALVDLHLVEPTKFILDKLLTLLTQCHSAGHQVIFVSDFQFGTLCQYWNKPEGKDGYLSWKNIFDIWEKNFLIFQFASQK